MASGIVDTAVARIFFNLAIIAVAEDARFGHGLKAMDTFGNYCQRPVFSLGYIPTFCIKKKYCKKIGLKLVI